MSDDILRELARTIRARKNQPADTSYTRQLLDAGPSRCAKKLGEEAVELALAAVDDDDKAVSAEAADLIYHMLVLLEARGIPLDDVLAELEQRMGTSGLVEKASRTG